MFSKRTKAKRNSDRQKRRSSVADVQSGRTFRRGSSLNTSRLRHAAIREQKLEQSRRHHHERSVTMWVVFIVLVAISATYLVATRITSIKIVSLGDNQQTTITNKKTYQANVNQVIEDRFLGNLQPFIPVDDISKTLMANHPEIQRVLIHNNGLTKTLTVRLEFRRPVIVWQTKSHQQFFLSDDGTAFQVNHTSVNSGDLIHLVDSSGLGAEAGKTLTSSQMIDFLLALHESLEKSGIDVSSYSLPKSLREIDVKLAGKPYVVKFLSTNDVGQEVAQLRQSLNFFTKHPDQTPSKYLDLRVIGRGFYQ